MHVRSLLLRPNPSLTLCWAVLACSAQTNLLRLPESVYVWILLVDHLDRNSAYTSSCASAQPKFPAHRLLPPHLVPLRLFTTASHHGRAQGELCCHVLLLSQHDGRHGGP